MRVLPSRLSASMTKDASATSPPFSQAGTTLAVGLVDNKYRATFGRTPAVLNSNSRSESLSKRFIRLFPACSATAELQAASSVCDWLLQLQHHQHCSSRWMLWDSARLQRNWTSKIRNAHLPAESSFSRVTEVGSVQQRVLLQVHLWFAV